MSTNSLPHRPSAGIPAAEPPPLRLLQRWTPQAPPAAMPAPRAWWQRLLARLAPHAGG